MEKFRITTLIDITRTRPHRSDPSELKHAQQSNFNALLQAINLRGIVAADRDPISDEGRLPEPWKGKARYWTYEFEVERSESYANDLSPFGLLLDDLDGVPIVDGLNNTTNFDVPVFKTKGDKFNTIIQKLY